MTEQKPPLGKLQSMKNLDLKSQQNKDKTQEEKVNELSAIQKFYQDHYSTSDNYFTFQAANNSKYLSMYKTSPNWEAKKYYNKKCATKSPQNTTLKYYKMWFKLFDYYN